jgi:very-short-patch-repair endonuclease
MPFVRDKKAAASPSARRHAPSLRRTLTGPEKKLWMLLRKRLPQEDTHFRRQVALGSYVVDFLCLSARLIVEVDGDQHGAEKALRYDEARTNWLEAGGFRVLRFTNRQVMTEADMVLDTIRAALIGTLEFRPAPPTPLPSPRGGGEEPHIR